MIHAIPPPSPPAVRVYHYDMMPKETCIDDLTGTVTCTEIRDPFTTPLNHAKRAGSFSVNPPPSYVSIPPCEKVGSCNPPTPSIHGYTATGQGFSSSEYDTRDGSYYYSAEDGIGFFQIAPRECVSGNWIQVITGKGGKILGEITCQNGKLIIRKAKSEER